MESICTGCEGKKVINCHVQKIIKGHRVCHESSIICPICKGTGFSTQEEVNNWLNSMIPYHEHV